MPFIRGVLVEEYERLKEKKEDYEKKLEELPKGAIVKKKIKSRSYNYLVYRFKGKVVTKYIKKESLDEIVAQLERRKKIEKSLASINQDIALIKKVIKVE